MNATIIALAGYIIWLMLLLLLLPAYRSAHNAKNKRKSLKFSPDGTDVSDFGFRITRAHLNTVESFPIVAGTMLLALATDSTSITNGLAYVVLAARVVQSVVHLISTSNPAITTRFVFFLIQFGICFYWLIMIVIKFI
ncbi:MAG: MAPEG family protein [Pseudomonadota bacterium]